MDGTIGEIRMFAGNFAPRQWAFCEGQLLEINSNTALFSILGARYGGDGRVTFGLPDFRGRVSMGAGNGPGLTPREFGQKFGTENNVLQVSQLPPHNHDAVVNVFSGDGTKRSAVDNFLGGDASTSVYSATPTSGKTLNPSSIEVGNTGSGRDINNIQPTTVMNYILCTDGLYPSRS